MNTSLIPTTEEFKQKLVQSIYNGNTYDYHDFISTKKTKIKNGNPYNRMDFIYENLINTFSNERFIVREMNSGNWLKHLQIYDKVTKALYVVAKEDRIQTVKMNTGFERAPHYIESYSLINENLGPIHVIHSNEQMSWDLNYDTSVVGNVLSLIGEFYNKKKSKLMNLMGHLEAHIFVLIPILIKNDKLMEVKAIVPRPEFLDPYYHTEDWSYYIPVEFIETESSINEGQGEAGEIQVAIKKNILEKHSVDPVIKKEKTIKGG